LTFVPEVPAETSTPSKHTAKEASKPSKVLHAFYGLGIKILNSKILTNLTNLQINNILKKFII